MKVDNEQDKDQCADDLMKHLSDQGICHQKRQQKRHADINDESYSFLHTAASSLISA